MNASGGPMTVPSELSLGALQARIATALMAAEPAGQRLPPDWFGGAREGSIGLRVHRNTVLSALSHALRLSYVAVDRLVGEDFFDRMAVGYARSAPPAAPQLDDYGEGFAEFVAGFPGTEKLPYLSELARLDWQIAELSRASDDADGGACIEMAGGVRLQFAAPLRTYRSTYAVGALRAAILEEDLKEIERAGGAPGEYHHALWRSASGVNVRSLSESSARFLAAVLAGADGAAALSAAAGAQPSAEQIASALASEILPAGFVSIGKARVPERSEPN